MDIRKPKGTRDFFPEDLKTWQSVESTFRDFAARYGYGEIRTPLFEDRALFERSIGEQTDIVGKELYILETGGGELALRPEQTASVARAYIENGLHKSAPFSKFFYIGAQFRHERQQKNRYRQFFQLGLEALGSRDPLLDAEIVDLTVNFLAAVGLEDLTVRLNTLGAPESLGRYRAALRDALEPHRDSLSKDDRARLDKNVLRVLDSKDEAVRKLLPDLPRISEFLSGEDTEHFDRVKKALDARQIAFEIDETLVRGFDYYTGPVFEVFYKSFGQQDAMGAGGRYDGLVEQLGGPDTPCVGIALGLDRIVNAVRGDEKKSTSVGKATELDIFVVNGHETILMEAKSVTGALRDIGIRADMDYQSKSQKAQIKIAKRRKALLALEFVKDPDTKEPTIWLRNLINWEDPVNFNQSNMVLMLQRKDTLYEVGKELLEYIASARDQQNSGQDEFKAFMELVKALQKVARTFVT